MHSVAGLHISAKLLVPASAQHIVANAEHRGFKLQAVSRFSSARRPVNALGFGYGAIATHDIDAGIALFADVACETGTFTRAR